MLTKNLKESSDENRSSSVQEEIPSDVPVDVGMKKSIDILTTVSHDRIELTDAQNKAEQKFFRTIDRRCC